MSAETKQNIIRKLIEQPSEQSEMIRKDWRQPVVAINLTEREINYLLEILGSTQRVEF